MKKFLSRVCTLVLVMGLLSGEASAAMLRKQGPFTDRDQIKQQEAVTLMADMGILAGRGDGSFDPAGTMDRAAMAKLLYGILMGGADPSTFALVETDLKDIAGHWGEDYIKYCYSVGILSGTGNGHFDPDGVVNVASAAKMLLVALGYDAVERGYTSNPFWSDNIMADARRVGLLEGITQFSFEPLTRDNGARMVYNALFSPIYVPQYGTKAGAQAIVSYQPRPTTLGLESFGLAKLTVRIDGLTELGEPMISVVSLSPRSKQIDDKGDTIRRLRNEFAFPPELAGREAAVYVKADWKLTEDGTALERLTLKDIYSRAFAPQEP